MVSSRELRLLSERLRFAGPLFFSMPKLIWVFQLAVDERRLAFLANV